jgi:hypothetical protein
LEPLYHFFDGRLVGTGITVDVEFVYQRSRYAPALRLILRIDTLLIGVELKMLFNLG